MKNEFWQDLLNSDWHDYRGSGNREDRLEDPVWRDRFLAAWRDDVAGVPPEDLVAGLRRLRETIRRLVDAYTAGRSVGRAEWTELNGVLDGSPCVRRMDESRGRPRLRLIPLRRGLPAVLAAIAASFAETVSTGDPDRIKTCRNPDCRWTFYDRSKNRSRKWCDNDCGNLIKVRRFRQKQKPAEGKRATGRSESAPEE
jgi:predicted RNA-binding Zn ribbon-like protein